MATASPDAPADHPEVGDERRSMLFKANSRLLDGSGALRFSVDAIPLRWNASVLLRPGPYSWLGAYSRSNSQNAEFGDIVLRCTVSSGR